MPEEKFGVENVTKLLLWGAGLTNGVVDALADKKITSGEGIKIAFEAIQIPYKSFNDLDDEINDFSEEEEERVKAAFVEKFDITNDEAETWVEDAIALVLMLLRRFLSKHGEVAEG